MWSLTDVSDLSNGWVNNAGLWRLEVGDGNTSLYPLVAALGVLALRIELVPVEGAERTEEPYDPVPAFMLWSMYRRLACSIRYDRAGVFDRTVYRQAGTDGHGYKRLLFGLVNHGGDETPTLFALIRLAGVLGLSVEIVDATTPLVEEPDGWPDSLPPFWFR